MALIRVLLGNIKGPKGNQGVVGPQGEQGVAGQNGKNGIGVAEGGIDGQVLVKDGLMDYGTRWGDVYLKDTMDSKLAIINTSLTTLDNSIKAINKLVNITLATEWEGTDETGYSQTVVVEGIKESSKPLVCLKLIEGDKAGNEKKREEYNKITDCWAHEGSITFYANEKTTIALTLLAKGV